MFDKLTERLGTVLDAVRGRGRITEDNIADALRQVRVALLEADVALPVVKSFIDSVKARALGAEVTRSLTPGQAFIKIIHDELVSAIGAESAGLNLRVQPPLIVLLAGLQGAGKTTTAGKLARWLQTQNRKRILLASGDVHRPAAILQLERLAQQLEVSFFPASANAKAEDIAAGALAQARQGLFDALIFDTAGRLHVDAEMMEEVRRIDAVLHPQERVFVVDSMAGQDAVNAARAFSAALELTGIILTKADGDARGGAALSVRQVTGKPILFMGVGEKIDALEAFHPERIASRILGMGDVLGLVEKVEQQVDREKAEQLARKLKRGHDFDFTDLRDQLHQLQQMGGLGALVDKLPAELSGAAARAGGMDEGQVRRQIAMINSMTPRERRRPNVIDGSRKRRIAAGSGVQVQDVNRLLKQFLQMQKTMKRFSKGGLQKLLRGMGGRMPPFPRG
ncbi:MAG TPA: signal recognition particle protein [Steroidobacteraceae bacterium]|nr:signal recognition particle protein [Steroidobacteraceae bacterium]